jgi:uncharacterized protein (DUF111 family)
MKPDRRRGLRDMTTLRTLSNQSTPANRIQAVSRFAMLENERVRVLRELGTWGARKDAAERKLATLEMELAELRYQLLGDQAALAPQRQVLSHASTAAKTMIEY